MGDVLSVQDLKCAKNKCTFEIKMHNFTVSINITKIPIFLQKTLVIVGLRFKKKIRENIF